MEWIEKAEGDYYSALREYRAHKNPRKSASSVCHKNKKVVIKLLYNIFFIITVFIISMSRQGFAQLKEFEIKELKPPPSIPVFINYPDNAALIIYSSLTNLYFESNMDAIVDDISTPQEGKYILIIREKTKQIITVKAKGFREGKIKVPKLNAKEVKYYQIEQLIIEGILAVQSTPEDAEVYINESLYGSTPYEGKFKKGTYEITLKKEMYYNLFQTVEVISDTTMEYFFDLFPKFGTLSLTSEPTDAEVFLDGSLKGKTPIEIDKIPSGEHRLSVRKKLYIDVLKMITITDGEELRDNIILTKTQEAMYKKDPRTAFLWSLFLPGTGQAYSKSSSKKFSIGVCVSWLCTYIFYDYWRQAKKNADYLYSVDPTGRDRNYTIYDDVDDKDRMGSEWRDEEKINQGTMIFFGSVSGLVHILAAVDASNKAKAYNKERGFSFNFNPKSNQFKLAFTHYF